jgi:hypothetical protein
MSKHLFHWIALSAVFAGSIYGAAYAKDPEKLPALTPLTAKMAQLQSEFDLGPGRAPAIFEFLVPTELDEKTDRPEWTFGIVTGSSYNDNFQKVEPGQVSARKFNGFWWFHFTIISKSESRAMVGLCKFTQGEANVYVKAYVGKLD